MLFEISSVDEDDDGHEVQVVGLLPLLVAMMHERGGSAAVTILVPCWVAEHRNDWKSLCCSTFLQKQILSKILAFYENSKSF